MSHLHSTFERFQHPQSCQAVNFTVFLFCTFCFSVFVFFLVVVFLDENDIDGGGGIG